MTIEFVLKRLKRHLVRNQIALKRRLSAIAKLETLKGIKQDPKLTTLKFTTDSLKPIGRRISTKNIRNVNKK